MRRITRRGMLAVLLGLAMVGAAPAAAQDWPAKPVRLVVPYPPGGNVDGAARIIGQALAARLGQAFVVENKPGATGLIAGELVAQAAPDGYTLLVAANGPILYSPLIYNRPVYQWDRDFVALGPISFTPNVLTVNAQLPAASLAELVRLARGRTLAMASPGAGTSSHLMSEMLQPLAGVTWTTVHYKGNAPAMTDLIAGEVQMSLDQLSVSLGQVKAGKLRALAVTSAERSRFLPDVPTFAEAGFPSIRTETFTGLFAPARTPPGIVERLHAALAEAARSDTVVQQFAAVASETRPMSRADFHAFLQREYDTFSAVIRQAKITAE